MQNWKPEGVAFAEQGCRGYEMQTLREAYLHGDILEGRAVLCSTGHDLMVDLGCCRGIIPRELAALGIEDGSTRDIAIISRVGKPVCFTVIGFEKDAEGRVTPLLSRVAVQKRCRETYLSTLRPGDIIDVRISHLETFGCFVDIGCGIPSLIPIDCISVSRIAHPGDRFRVGQDIKAVVRAIDPESGRITLSHKELLGSWEENAALFTPGETVTGIARSVEEYGIFVELTPNLAGLAEPHEGVNPGQSVSVYIKSLLPRRMKVKLIVVGTLEPAAVPAAPHYFRSEGHIDRWRYSPEGSSRTIETIFG